MWRSQEGVFPRTSGPTGAPTPMTSPGSQAGSVSIRTKPAHGCSSDTQPPPRDEGVRQGRGDIVRKLRHGVVHCCVVAHPVWCGVVWCSVAWCGAVQCSAVQCGAARCSVVDTCTEGWGMRKGGECVPPCIRASVVPQASTATSQPAGHSAMLSVLLATKRHTKKKRNKRKQNDEQTT
eukprot:COSAG06_NODE_2771_length_6311_cov_12.386671_6_plen_178_part_00